MAREDVLPINKQISVVRDAILPGGCWAIFLATLVRMFPAQVRIHPRENDAIQVASKKLLRRLKTDDQFFVTTVEAFKAFCKGAVEDISPWMDNLPQIDSFDPLEWWDKYEEVAKTALLSVLVLEGVLEDASGKGGSAFDDVTESVSDVVATLANVASQREIFRQWLSVFADLKTVRDFLEAMDYPSRYHKK